MQNNILLRKCDINDAAALREIERLCLPGHKENFDLVLRSDNYLYVCTTDGESIVGYAGASISYEQSDILYVAVLPKHRRQGIATKLLNELIYHLEKRGVTEVFLDVNENNLAAISLYLRLGFEKINTRKNYYGDSDAIIMKKVLKN